MGVTSGGMDLAKIRGTDEIINQMNSVKDAANNLVNALDKIDKKTKKKIKIDIEAPDSKSIEEYDNRVKELMQNVKAPNQKIKYFQSIENATNSLKKSWNVFATSFNAGLLGDDEKLFSNRKTTDVLRYANAYEALGGNLKEFNPEIADFVSKMRQIDKYTGENGYPYTVKGFKEAFEAFSELKKEFGIEFKGFDKLENSISNIISLSKQAAESVEDINTYSSNHGSGSYDESGGTSNNPSKANETVVEKAKETALTLSEMKKEIESKVREINHIDYDFELSIDIDDSLSDIEKYNKALQELKAKQENALESAHYWQNIYANKINAGEDTINSAKVMEYSIQDYQRYTDEIKYVQNKLDEAINNYVPGKSNDNGVGFSKDDIIILIYSLKQLVDEVANAREAFGSIDNENGVTTLLSQIKEISKSISETSAKINDLSEKFSNINLNVSINAGKNPIQQMSEYGTKATKTIEELQEQYHELLRIAEASGIDESKLLGMTLKTDSSGKVFDAYDGLSSKTKKTKMQSYNIIVNEYKKALEGAGIDLSQFNNKFTVNMNEVVASTEKMLTTATEVTNGFDSLFKGVNNVNFENVNKQLKDIIESLKNISELLKSGFKIDATISGLDDTGDLSNETNSLETLAKQVDTVTEAVDKKTKAFQKESDVVSEVIENEVLSLNLLFEAIGEVTEAAEKFSSAFVEPANDTFLFSSLNEILSKKDELVNLATYLKAEKNSVKDAKEQVNNKKSQEAYSYLANNTSDIENAVSVFLGNKNETLLNSKMEVMSNGLIKITALTQDAQDQFSQYVLTCSTKGEILEKSIERGTAALEKQIKAYNKKKSTESIAEAENESKELDEYNKALKTYYTLENKKNKKGSLSAVDENAQKNAYTVMVQYEEKLNNLKQQGIALTEKQAKAEETAANYKKDSVSMLKKQVEDNLNIESLEKRLNKLKKEKPQNASSSYTKKLDEIEEKIANLKNKLPIDGDIIDEGSLQKEKEDIEKLLKGVSNNLDLRHVSDIETANLEKKIRNWMNKNTVAANAYGNELDEILSKIKNLGTEMTKQDSLDIEGQFAKIQTKALREGKIGISFIDEIQSKLKSLGSYLLSFASFYDLINIGKQAVSIVTELDDALTEMRKVSDEPLSVLKNYQLDTFDVANDLGTTSSVLQNSTADWMRLGESIEDAAESAKVTTTLLNVSEFESIDDATDSLVSMSQAYTELDKIDIVDKLNNIGNNFSISTDGLASALQTSAAALKVAGNDMDEAIALVTAGNAIVQDPASVGSGIRTIALRIQGTEEAKQELADLGEDVDDYVVATSSKLNEQVINFTKAAGNDFKGVSLLDEHGNQRDTYNIMQDIADVYDEIIEDDKKFGTNRMQGLLELLAGKNRSNIVASILQNGDMLREVYEASQNSEGSAQEELEKHLDSISGKTEQLQNRLQELASVSIDSEGLKVVIGLLTQGVSLVTSFVNKFGSINTIISAITAVASLKGAGGTNKKQLFLKLKMPAISCAMI